MPISHRIKIVIGLLLTLVASVQAQLTGERESIRLDQGWESVVTPSGGAVVPTEGWQEAKAPGFMELSPNGGSHDLWYRRKLEVPRSWLGRLIMLDLRSARYCPQVYVDGKKVAEQFDGWSPFEADITQACTAGTHQLVVRCRDFGATFAPGFKWPAGTGEDALRGKVLAPIGGYKNMMGLVYPAYIRTEPIAGFYGSSLSIQTSVRKGILTVYGNSRAAGARVVCQVWDGNRHVLDVPPVSTDSFGEWKNSVAFPSARYWSPEDPHLYELRVTLEFRDGVAADRISRRFGFRELWTEGPNFFLNGIKRHMIASATWPVEEWLDPATVRKRVLAVKASGVDMFRLHIGPWQEEFAEAADEIGLMLVDEAAVYTDGSGMYAYKDPAFWAHYRDHIAGIIDRDRNHASVVMWSLGNEILFMGNERYDADLPKKLGALAPFARSLDPTRPVTFEADLDPDGKYDVIGLHYPHELPFVYAYPQAADWLGSRTMTEAAGGMLGNKSSDFVWTRKKPLYIGEYLWCPQGDYSPGSVYFGDEAYLNRDEANLKAKGLSWIDQTIAYRRSGVSGMAPWTAFEFGMADGATPLRNAQAIYSKRQAAFLREKELRFFSGESAKLPFDVFNDGLSPSRMKLRVSLDGKLVGSWSGTLQAADYAQAFVAVRFPPAKQRGEVALTYQLLADGKAVDRKTASASVFPRLTLPWSEASIFDPSGGMPNSHRELEEALRGHPKLLVVGPNALGKRHTASTTLPEIGGNRFDAALFRTYLEEGGKCVVMEQSTLAPLGLGVDLVEHASTMSFALNPHHPILARLSKSDLSHWRGDGYVSHMEIKRSGVAALRSVTVSGGSDALAQGPIAEMRVGRGAVVFLQCEAGEKLNVDPAAGRVINNALSYLQKLTAGASGTVLTLGASEAELDELKALGVPVTAVNGPLDSEQAKLAAGIYVSGGEGLAGSGPALSAALGAGTSVYWHMPTPDAFASLAGVMGASGLEVRPSVSSPTLRGREDTLLNGVSREDLVYATPPVGWDHTTLPKAHETSLLFHSVGVAAGAIKTWPSGQLVTDRGHMETREGEPALSLDRRASATITVTFDKAGFHDLTVLAEGQSFGGQAPVYGVYVDQVADCWLEAPSDWAVKTTTVYVPAGTHQVSLAFQNGGEWGGPRTMAIRKVELGPTFSFPSQFSVLAMPSSVVSWKMGMSRVVVDGITPDNSVIDRTRHKRYLASLLVNLGFPLNVPKFESGDVIPNSAFTATGGRYNTVDGQRIELRSNGTADADFLSNGNSRFELDLVASSTPCQGEYSRVRVYVDKALWGDKEIASPNDAAFSFAPKALGKGKHRLTIEFYNDASTATEDRNLTVKQVAFKQVGVK